MRAAATFLIGLLTPFLSAGVSIPLNSLLDLPMRLSLNQKHAFETVVLALACVLAGWLAARHDRHEGTAHWLWAMSGLLGVSLLFLVAAVLSRDAYTLVELPAWVEPVSLLTPPVAGALGVRLAGRGPRIRPGR